jgi:aryl-alcohol dehydrogenase-like predicted oxidoreductase
LEDVGGGGISDEQARSCIDTAFACGINFIDTANIYSGGASESFLGEVLSKRPRDSYVLATKLRFPVGDGSGEGLSAEQVHKQIGLLLRRLQTDYVDLYQCHRSDPNTPLEETMMALTCGQERSATPASASSRLRRSSTRSNSRGAASS